MPSPFCSSTAPTIPGRPKVSESFQAALVAAGYDSRLLTIPETGHLETLARKDSIDAIMKIAKGS